MKPKVGVVLSGCGVYDGAEIHESVLTLLALDRAGAEAVCLAPDVAQRHVVNHLTGQPAEGETRNVLVEAARIARGKVRSLAGFDAGTLDALVLPGGFGAAKNLCDFAFRGADCEVHPEVARVVRAVHAAGKPVGAVCIAPVILARLLGAESPQLTIGPTPAPPPPSRRWVAATSPAKADRPSSTRRSASSPPPPTCSTARSPRSPPASRSSSPSSSGWSGADR